MVIHNTSILSSSTDELVTPHASPPSPTALVADAIVSQLHEAGSPGVANWRRPTERHPYPTTLAGRE
ncbi:MAG: hypothetical protein JOZ78_24190 [Chroococcidiopsidaceae cyanobacterium CP_BM_ER_R8_30]|nr:hypothetical protein [Chroococcidiopsidaceae cyanobacterium CP_BM_ER_R8_30]